MQIRSMWCVLLAACTLPMLLGAQGAGKPDPKDGWIPLFNGKDLTGWNAREADKPNGWKVPG